MPVKKRYLEAASHDHQHKSQPGFAAKDSHSHRSVRRRGQEAGSVRNT